MSLLDRKLIRDLLKLKSQALAVALVMACGLAMMIMTRSLILSLETTRDAYYSENRFAQVFARNTKNQTDVFVYPGMFFRQFGLGFHDEAVERHTHFGQQGRYIEAGAAGEGRQQQHFGAGTTVVAQRRFRVDAYGVVVDLAVESHFSCPGSDDVVCAHVLRKLRVWQM